MADVTTDAVHVFLIESGCVGGCRAILEPSPRGVTAQTELAHAGQVLVGNGQRRQEDGIAHGLGHHAAGPRKHGVSLAVSRIGVAHAALLDLGKFDAGLLRLHARQKDLCRYRRRHDQARQTEQQETLTRTHINLL